MISRTWKGLVPTSKKQAYLSYIQKTGLDEYGSTQGNLGVYLLLREIGDNTEFHTLTFWDSYASIKKFAGEDYSRAKYYPKDDEYLLEKTEFVEHSSVVYGQSDKISVSL
jgi:heme-degrading monooxygenase HmoA